VIDCAGQGRLWGALRATPKEDGQSQGGRAILGSVPS
jgi:hypothetical protein